VTISPKLLGSGERIIIGTRTHLKALLWPTVLLLVVAALAGYLATLPSGEYADIMQMVLWGAVALIVLIWVVVPYLRWLTSTYTLTNRRLITRTGILSRRGHDIPLTRISDVAYEHGIIDRLLKCGTLIVSDASEQGRVVLHDIPSVETFHLTVSELLHSPQSPTSGEAAATEETRRLDDGT
jgi:uncharacterized membrane protein YdbT with pleckstrin-like domain